MTFNVTDVHGGVVDEAYQRLVAGHPLGFRLGNFTIRGASGGCRASGNNWVLSVGLGSVHFRSGLP
jgi:hypothetical protein